MSTERRHRFGDKGGSVAAPLPRLPADYLRNGYFDQKGNVLPQVIQDWAKDIAQELYKSKPRMSTTQLRGRFFAEVRRLEKRLDTTHDFDMVKPEILKLKAYAQDAEKKNKVPSLFKQFMELNVHWAAKGEKEFTKGFINHFECVVAYYPEVRGG